MIGERSTNFYYDDNDRLISEVRAYVMQGGIERLVYSCDDANRLVHVEYFSKATFGAWEDPSYKVKRLPSK